MFFPLHLCLLCNKIFPLCLRHHTSVNDICSVGRAVASWVASDARPPIWNRCNPISRLAHRLLHTSNTVFKKCAPLLFFGPPAAKSWRQAWVLSVGHPFFTVPSLSANIYCEMLEAISDLKIFPECSRGPLKTLWRATCGPWACNCPPLVYMVGGTFFKVGGHKCTPKKCKKIL